VLVLAWAPGTADAAAPRIAYADDGEGRGFDLFTVKPDGHGKHRLTDDNAADRAPSWAPDRNRLVLVRFTLSRTAGRLFTIHADGRGLKPIAHALYADDPDWSRDGTRIAFSAYRLSSEHESHNYIYTIRPDGSDRRRLTEPGYHAYDPAWSPDSSEIAFERGDGLWKMRADGTHLRKLARNAGQPDWAPNGKHIAFVRPVERSDGSSAPALFTMRPDGSHVRRLAPRGAAPSWSPSGERIAFEQAAGESTRIAVIAYPGGKRPGAKDAIAPGLEPAW
jgi:Tol biopolymer transport system component